MLLTRTERMLLRYLAQRPGDKETNHQIGDQIGRSHTAVQNGLNKLRSLELIECDVRHGKIHGQWWTKRTIKVTTDPDRLYIAQALLSRRNP